MACNLEVVKMLRQRGLGNSVARLRQNLVELHGEENLKRTAHYLSDCQTFSTAQKREQVTRTIFNPPRISSCQWLTSVYCQEVLSILEEVKAAITSVYGRVLKVDSTKKVAKKLQGSAAETAAWATNVGNEHGQVLMSVLTAGEGAGLDSHVRGHPEAIRRCQCQPTGGDVRGPGLLWLQLHWEEIPVFECHTDT